MRSWRAPADPRSPTRRARLSEAIGQAGTFCHRRKLFPVAAAVGFRVWGRIAAAAGNSVCRRLGALVWPLASLRRARRVSDRGSNGAS